MALELDKKLTIDERDSLVEFINDHVDELAYNDKRDILTMLITNVPDSNKKIKHKGTGTQIPYKDISNDLIIWIYNKIYSKLT
jgi:hypothetical protein